MSKQLTAVAAALASLATADTFWTDLPNFAESSTVNPLDAITKNNCFQVSQIKGKFDTTTEFKSDLSNLKMQYREGMEMRRLTLCGTSTEV
jgi:hypothetical protein